MPNRDFGCHAAQRAELEEPRQLRVSLQRFLEREVFDAFSKSRCGGLRRRSRISRPGCDELHPFDPPVRRGAVRRAVEAVFAPVSDEDFWAAISNEAEAYDFHSYAPRYLASNVLILGRILSFKMEEKILSKYEAGLWMMRNLPPEFTE